MIAINLLPGARKKRGAKGVSFALPDLKALAATVKDPWLIAAVAGWAIVAVVVVLFYLPRRNNVAELEPRLRNVQRQAARMQAAIRQKESFERTRDSLLAQVAVIRDIDRDRYVWPHILDAVTRALPEYTWLDDVTSRTVEGDTVAGGVNFQITGKSADVQAITRFVRNLEESRFIQRVTTVSTGAVSEQGREVFTFVLNARYEEPDSSQITLQPLAASLVQGFRSGGGARRRD
jgi:Tfp pilus assembly protein PilN